MHVDGKPTHPATEAVHRSQLDETTTALDALTAALDGNADLATALQRACEQVIRVIPGADLASVSALEEVAWAQTRTLACTGDTAYHLDEQQYIDRDGPCLDAAATNEVSRGDLDEATARWPGFSSALKSEGVASYLAAPFYVGNNHAGALNLYGRQAHGFREIDGALLELYTSAVEAVLRATTRQHEARQLAEQLSTALQSRAEIEQAKGILMATMNISAEAAFDILVEQSQHNNVKLREVARRIVENTSPG